MQLTLKDELPFTTLKIAYQGAEIEVADVLVDTGSASTILSADIMAQIGITPEPTDMLQRLSQFQIEIGGMDYGFGISGILGMDFLVQAGAIIHLRDLELEFLNG